MSETEGTDVQRSPNWPGEDLGLPKTGAGSVAGAGRRLGALLIDLVLASLITALFVRPEVAEAAVMQQYNYLALALWVGHTVLSASLFGMTPGMAALGIRVARMDGARMVGPVRALIRCVLTFLIIPVLIRNHDGRGWHDRATGTIVVRLR
ncbi:RDD family protein [Tamaricihabitans halophyticus]|uniref:RDD family protein n=1 Tax=Tamaricihabitans halophyticus TaxID=1262583 RepID=UPI001FB43EEB|nr:RDD family protein [Tamaricihabitans halophyticus]